MESFESLTTALSSSFAAHSVAAHLDKMVALFVENIGMILSFSAHILKRNTDCFEAPDAVTLHKPV